VASPLARVAVLLDQLAEVADEIVCAVDSRVTRDETAALDARADLVARCEFDPDSGIERNLAWLHSLCSGKWVLRIDSDEVVSSALLAALPAMLDADDVAQYLIRRLWSYPDVEHVLSEPPWSDDWQNRLVRNEPFLLRFPGLLHSSAETVTPFRYVEAPIYHLDCILKTEVERTAKAEHYQGIREDVGSAGGKPTNDFYLPERYPSTSLRPIPEEDIAQLQAAVAASAIGIASDAKHPRHRRIASADVPMIAFDEIDRHWALRSVPESAYRCELEILGYLGALHENESRIVAVRVRNLGTEKWPHGNEQPEIRLGHRWFDRDGTSVIMEGARSPFPADVPPGTESIQRMTVKAPPTPGSYQLELNVLHEHHRWFATGMFLPVEVIAERYEESDYDEEFYSVKIEGMLKSARHVLGVVVPMLNPTSAVDVGCGEGAWLSVCQEYGVADTVGLDGDWVRPERLQIPVADFVATDLTKPIDLDQTFDLAICLEVAEHLEAEYSEVLVTSIANLAPAVLFSAAVPGQGGVHHVNEQWPDYWLSKFEARGFECFDVVRPKIWSNELVDWWYCQNTFLLLREDHPSRGDIVTLSGESRWPHALVHPRAWTWTG
jgi:SAM-dependent methyltransferase